MTDLAKTAADRVLDRIEKDQAIHRSSVEEEIAIAIHEHERFEDGQARLYDFYKGALAEPSGPPAPAWVPRHPQSGAPADYAFEPNRHEMWCRGVILHVTSFEEFHAIVASYADYDKGV